MSNPLFSLQLGLVHEVGRVHQGEGEGHSDGKNTEQHQCLPFIRCL